MMALEIASKNNNNNKKQRAVKDTSGVTSEHVRIAG